MEREPSEGGFGSLLRVTEEAAVLVLTLRARHVWNRRKMHVIPVSVCLEDMALSQAALDLHTILDRIFIDTLTV